MKISKKDAEIFLPIYMALLHSIYQTKYNRLCKNGEDFVTTRNILYKNLFLVDEFIELSPDLKPKFINVLKNIYFGFVDTFIYIRTLKKYSIFYRPSNNKFYRVLGVTNSIDQLVPDEFTYIDTAILNFKNQIICDGLIINKNTFCGPNIKKELKEEYRLAKENNEIISFLETN